MCEGAPVAVAPLLRHRPTDPLGGEVHEVPRRPDDESTYVASHRTPDAPAGRWVIRSTRPAVGGRLSGGRCFGTGLRADVGAIGPAPMSAMAATAGVGHPPAGTAAATGGTTAASASILGVAATTTLPPQPWQPTQAERLRSHHLLEAWLQPYKDEIMGVYVNVLIGHKPVYALGFYAAYALLLGYVPATR